MKWKISPCSNFIRSCFSFLSALRYHFAMQQIHTPTDTHFLIFFLLLLLTLEVAGSIPLKIHNVESLTNCQHLEYIFPSLWSHRYLHSEESRSDPCHAWHEHLLGMSSGSLISRYFQYQDLFSLLKQKWLSAFKIVFLMQ